MKGIYLSYLSYNGIIVLFTFIYIYLHYITSFLFIAQEEIYHSKEEMH